MIVVGVVVLLGRFRFLIDRGTGVSDGFGFARGGFEQYVGVVEGFQGRDVV